MKTTKRIVDMDTIVFRCLGRLREIPKVHQRANGDEEVLGNGICDNGHDITLDVTMFPAGDLLQLGYAFMKLSKTCVDGGWRIGNRFRRFRVRGCTIERRGPRTSYASGEGVLA